MITLFSTIIIWSSLNWRPERVALWRPSTKNIQVPQALIIIFWYLVDMPVVGRNYVVSTSMRLWLWEVKFFFFTLWYREWTDLSHFFPNVNFLEAQFLVFRLECYLAHRDSRDTESRMLAPTSVGNSINNRSDAAATPFKFKIYRSYEAYLLNYASISV